MSVVGIIAEFNPFHNGHKYLIEQAKKKTHSEYAIAVISGNYVQRGVPAVCDKFLRTQMAVENGCDLVIEIPCIYSCGSAGYFAEGAVHLLNSLGCIDYLAFGVEHSNMEFLEKITEILYREPDCFRERLNHYAKNGLSFPLARENALYDYLCSCREVFDKTLFHKIMSSPNCILAMEYLRALKKFRSPIKPVSISRVQASYHQLSIEGSICSAAALRNVMHDIRQLREAKNSLPQSVYSLLETEFHSSFPIYENDFSPALAAALIHRKSDLSEFFDFSSDFSNRVQNLLDDFNDFDSFSDALTAKNLTKGYVNRCLLHVMLDISTSFVKEAIRNGYNYYVRVLGFPKAGVDLLGQIHSACALPVITKLSAAPDFLSSPGLQVLKKNQTADELYRLIQNIKYKSHIPNEYKRGLYLKK